MPLIDLNTRQIFFIHIPKTSGSSLYYNLKKLEKDCVSVRGHVDGIPLTHLHIEMAERYWPDYYSYRKFTIVREPKQRLLSGYLYRNQQIETLEDFDQWLSKLFVMLDNNRSYMRNHFRPQVDFIPKDTKIFDIEEQDTIYTWLSDYLDIIDIPHGIVRNKQSTDIDNTNVDIFDYMSDINIAKFNSLYGKDIDMHNHLTK